MKRHKNQGKVNQAIGILSLSLICLYTLPNRDCKMTSKTRWSTMDPNMSFV